MFKPFSGEKNSKSRRIGAQNGGFFGKMGVETLDFGFSTPKRHAEPRRLAYFASKSVRASRPLLERLRELFRRNGLTIGALITALGMIISTIFLAVQPAPTAAPPRQPDKNTFKDRVKRQLVKIANWLLGLAKKALVSLP